MYRLEHVEPKDATGIMAEVYGIFPPGIEPPAPMVLMSASPGLAKLQSGFLGYFMGHERLDNGLLALIRFIAAKEFCHDFCETFNAGMLQRAGGFSAEELEAIAQDPGKAPLEESQRALLVFVHKVLRTPREVRNEDIQALRDLGWRDSDILDAAFHGTSMAAGAPLYKAFIE